MKEEGTIRSAEKDAFLRRGRLGSKNEKEPPRQKGSEQSEGRF